MSHYHRQVPDSRCNALPKLRLVVKNKYYRPRLRDNKRKPEKFQKTSMSLDDIIALTSGLDQSIWDSPSPTPSPPPPSSQLTIDTLQSSQYSELLAGLDENFFDELPSSPETDLEYHENSSSETDSDQHRNKRVKINHDFTSSRPNATSEQKAVSHIKVEFDIDDRQELLGEVKNGIKEEAKNEPDNDAHPQSLDKKIKETLSQVEDVVHVQSSTSMNYMHLLPSTKCTVESISSRDNGNMQVLAVRVCESEEDEPLRHVYLYNQWAREVEIAPNDIINVIGHFTMTDSAWTIHVTGKDMKMIVLHPDDLIPIHKVAGAAYCRRKAVLDGFVAPSKRPSLEARQNISSSDFQILSFNIIRVVILACLQESCWDRNWISQKIFDVLRMNTTALVRHGKVLKDIHAKLLPSVTIVLDFEKAIRQKLQGLDALAKEEFLWSPRYGLTGRLDSSIRAVQDGSSYVVPLSIKYSRVSKRWDAPFTGPSLADCAHALLLGLLIAERYSMPVGKGFLYFLDEPDALKTVGWSQNEIRDIFIMRNLLAFHARRQTFGNVDMEDVASRLPQVSWDLEKRKICFRKDLCLLYARVYEGDVSTHVSEQLQDVHGSASARRSFRPTHIDYNFFKKYDRMLHAQETGMIQDNRNFEIWTVPATEREMYGTCLSDMVIDSSYVNDNLSPSRLYKYEYLLKRRVSSPRTYPLTEAGQLSHGTTIVVSSGRHVAAAVGFVISLDPDSILIRVDQCLPRRDLRGFQSLDGHPDVWVYRIDLEDTFLDAASLRNHLLRQLSSISHQDERLRRLVVYLAEPKYLPQGSDKPLTKAIRAVDPELDPELQQAIERVLSAQDYVLLRIRRAGDEAKIAYTLIHSIIEMDQKILLIGANHETIDKLLLMQMPMKDIVRLGSPSKVHSKIRRFVLKTKPLPLISKLVEECKIAAATCYSTALLEELGQKFDWCIILGASRIPLPACLSTMRFADRSILIGDGLPFSLKSNPNLRQIDYIGTMFYHLAQHYPNLVVDP